MHPSDGLSRRLERGSRRASARLSLQGLRGSDDLREPTRRDRRGGESPPGHRRQLERGYSPLVDAREAGDHGAGRRVGPAHRRAGFVLLLALIAALAVGCGSDESEEAGGGDSTAPSTPATELTIT